MALTDPEVEGVESRGAYTGGYDRSGPRIRLLSVVEAIVAGFVARLNGVGRWVEMQKNHLQAERSKLNYGDLESG